MSRISLLNHLSKQVQEDGEEFSRVVPTKVFPFERELLNREICKEEIHFVLSKMKNDKSLGLDDLLCYFLKTIWSMIGGDLFMIGQEIIGIRRFSKF
jgi:hypothetical protein